MRSADDSPDGRVHDPLDQLRHDLKSPLTAISGRAHLVARAIRCSPSLADDERVKMLDGLAQLDRSVREMVTVIDGMGEAGADGRRDAE